MARVGTRTKNEKVGEPKQKRVRRTGEELQAALNESLAKDSRLLERTEARLNKIKQRMSNNRMRLMRLEAEDTPIGRLLKELQFEMSKPFNQIDNDKIGELNEKIRQEKAKIAQEFEAEEQEQPE